ncbi:uncharacterized protein LOC107021442 isoform X4 [Solanum pennellii]|uniref:Uncharacterized protein LOC107021442 isoform X4 n=1 Tax=Solanum pennellii TaxID=28526 RepID=A0ABM1VDW5_SOLPN|nr:uncharacterized protein LOC107021442 isoform X4 [Solanum pennellii]
MHGHTSCGHSSGCLGSVSKTKLTSSVHEHLKEKKHLDHLVHKAKLSADFWSTSTGDMDNYSAAQSQGSISSISTSTQAPDAHGAANTNNHSEFVNHVLFIQDLFAGTKSDSSGLDEKVRRSNQNSFLNPN